MQGELQTLHLSSTVNERLFPLFAGAIQQACARGRLLAVKLMLNYQEQEVPPEHCTDHSGGRIPLRTLL
jgi:hypothetical protein